jgi:hypothetical protein
MSGSPFTPAEKAQAMRLYEVEKLGVDKIAHMIGRTGVGVWRMLKREGVKIRDHNDALKLRKWTWAPSSHAAAAKKGFITQASNAANQYYQPSLISFMPDSPRLEMEWRHVLADVQAERGTQWRTITLAMR